MDHVGHLGGQGRVARGRVRRANSSSGKPKKSWIVRGSAMAVTAVALMYQWADTTRMARGRGMAVPKTAPKARQACV